MNDSPTDNFRRLGATVMRYLTLRLDYARLSAVEKLTVLLSTVAFFAIAVIIGMIAIVFISIGIGHLLSTTIAPHAAYLYVSAFYIVLLAVIILFRRQLIFNPSARFLSRLLLKPDDDDEI